MSSDSETQNCERLQTSTVRGSHASVIWLAAPCDSGSKISNYTITAVENPGATQHAYILAVIARTPRCPRGGVHGRNGRPFLAQVLSGDRIRLFGFFSRRCGEPRRCAPRCHSGLQMSWKCNSFSSRGWQIFNQDLSTCWPSFGQTLVVAFTNIFLK